MKIVIGASIEGVELKNELVSELRKSGFEVLDVSNEGDKDFYDASIKVTNEVLKDINNNKGIIIDEFGSGSFMVADKFKYIICAQLNDEHSAKMTRDNNNANVITMGSGVIGSDVAKRIAHRFAEAKYSGGRHQIRVDMLNKMC